MCGCVGLAINQTQIFILNAHTFDRIYTHTHSSNTHSSREFDIFVQLTYVRNEYTLENEIYAFHIELNVSVRTCDRLANILSIRAGIRIFVVKL